MKLKVTCYSTTPWRCRRLVRKAGAIHCHRCHQAKRSLVNTIRDQGEEGPFSIFWAIAFGVLNSREVQALFPSGKTCRRYGHLVNASTGEVLR